MLRRNWRSTWARHVERMGDEKLAKRADAQKVEGMTEIAPGNCINSDLERVGHECRKRATDRRNWRLLTENVV